jgi:hypothetical protein
VVPNSALITPPRRSLLAPYWALFTIAAGLYFQYLVWHSSLDTEGRWGASIVLGLILLSFCGLLLLLWSEQDERIWRWGANEFNDVVQLAVKQYGFATSDRTNLGRISSLGVNNRIFFSRSECLTVVCEKYHVRVRKRSLQEIDHVDVFHKPKQLKIAFGSGPSKWVVGGALVGGIGGAMTGWMIDGFRDKSINVEFLLETQFYFTDGTKFTLRPVSERISFSPDDKRMAAVTKREHALSYLKQIEDCVHLICRVIPDKFREVEGIRYFLWRLKVGGKLSD